MGSILDGMTIDVETTWLPRMTFNVAEELAADPGVATRILSPRITVRRGDLVLVRSEPAGPPRPELRTFALLVAAGLLAWVVLR